VPGRLSGPLRLGTRSYSHSLDRRTQLLQTGLVESHLILRLRLKDECQMTLKRERQWTHHWRQAMTTEDISLRDSLPEVLASAGGDASERVLEAAREDL
jgi:hypothetical protein